MRALPKVRVVIEKELALFPKDLCDQFGDDTYIRLRHEEELLRKLLAVTEEYIREQTELERRLEAYV